jgi:hypothetical protein
LDFLEFKFIANTKNIQHQIYKSSNLELLNINRTKKSGKINFILLHNLLEPGGGTWCKVGFAFPRFHSFKRSNKCPLYEVSVVVLIVPLHAFLNHL